MTHSVSHGNLSFPKNVAMQKMKSICLRHVRVDVTIILGYMYRRALAFHVQSPLCWWPRSGLEVCKMQQSSYMNTAVLCSRKASAIQSYMKQRVIVLKSCKMDIRICRQKCQLLTCIAEDVLCPLTQTC